MGVHQDRQVITRANQDRHQDKMAVLLQAKAETRQGNVDHRSYLVMVNVYRHFQVWYAVRMTVNVVVVIFVTNLGMSVLKDAEAIAVVIAMLHFVYHSPKNQESVFAGNVELIAIVMIAKRFVIMVYVCQSHVRRIMNVLWIKFVIQKQVHVFPSVIVMQSARR